MLRRARFGGGWLVWLVVVISWGGLAAMAAATQFSASVYPPPVASRGGALAACPNPAGLERFNSTSRKLAVKDAGSYGRVSLAFDLRHSDRAWWPTLRQMWRSANPGRWLSLQIVRGSVLGPHMFQSGVARYSCGSTLVADSLDVVVGPRNLHNSNDSTVSLVFIDRRGRTLVYWVH
jgi:hypothetical protein